MDHSSKQTAKKTGHPYSVIEITTKDIFNFKLYADAIAKNWGTNKNGERGMISTYIIPYME